MITFRPVFRPIMALCALLALSACQQTSPSALSSAAASQNTKALSLPVKEVKSAGLTAWLIENTSQPLVSMQLIIDGAGSATDPTGKEGRAMFAAALMDEGAGTMDALAFQRALDDKAIELSFSTNEDALVVQLRCLSAHVPDALALLQQALTKPRFAAEDMERKRRQALSTLARAEAHPRFILRKHASEMAYLDHPYASPALGTKASLTAMQSRDLHDYVASAIAKNRLTISVAGDISHSVLSSLLANYLGDLPASASTPAIADTTIQHLGVTSVIQHDAPQTQVMLLTPAIDRKDERFLAAYVLNHIVGGNTLNSILGEAIRERQGLAYSVSSYLDPMQHASNFVASFATRNEAAGQALDTLKAELTAVATNGVSQQQFDDAMDYITGSFVLSLDKNANLTFYLGTMQRHDLGMDYLATRNAQMRAVTREQVNAIAKEWFAENRWLIIAVGEPEGMTSSSP